MDGTDSVLDPLEIFDISNVLLPLC